MKAAIVTVVVLIIGLLAIRLYSQTGSNPQEFAGQVIDVPEFAIAIKLSPKADERLRNLHETVKVISYFDGDPLPGRGEYNPPYRDVFLGSDEKLVDGGNVARFSHTKVPLSDWKRLSDKNYFVSINTVSARHVAPDNLLECADFSRKIESLKGRTIEIECWLIGESNLKK